MSDDHGDPKDVYAAAVAELQDKAESQKLDEEYLSSLTPEEMERELRKRVPDESAGLWEPKSGRRRLAMYMVASQLLEEAKDLARRWRKEARRPLGVVGELAGQEAARLLKLNLMGQGNPGYDAVWGTLCSWLSLTAILIQRRSSRLTARE
jgi:hypothetical protein